MIDYKYMCFNGKAAMLYVLADRTIGHGAECGFFDLEFNKLSVTESDEEPLRRSISKPDNYDEMVSIAERLAQRFPCARIDLYNTNGKILFGEITFLIAADICVLIRMILIFSLVISSNFRRTRRHNSCPTIFYRLWSIWMC